MIIRKKIKNKKGVSEIISYVLLIVISLGLATGVYTWLKIYVAPSQNEADICQENTAITLNDYSCALDGLNKIISLDLQNTGYFSIDGFFIKASNISGNGLATNSIKTIDYQNPINGRYDFSFLNLKFSPGKKITAKFAYNELGSINKIHIQPFVIGPKSKTIIPCENKIELDISSCDTSPAASIAPTATDCSSPVTNGLVAFWRFEKDATDCMGRNNGSIIGNVNWGTGKKDKGLTLDGTNGNYISVPNSADIQFGTNNFTISFWINIIASGNYNLLNKYEGVGTNRWKITSNMTDIRFLKYLPGIINTPYSVNNWKQIMIIRNGNNSQICNDKNCISNSTFFNSLDFSNNMPLKIGCDESGSNCLNGTIDEVMIFNRPLSPAEINQL